MTGAAKDRYLHEGLITALAVGGFLIILGAAFALTPGIYQATNNFFSDLTLVNYHSGSAGTANLLAPAHPADHTAFYDAVVNFFIGIGVLEIIILALRIAFHSRVRRIAQTVGDLVFWLGAAFVGYIFLLAGTLTGWWQFWSSIIILIGASLIARFFVYLTARSQRKVHEP
jgi:hypothetical protein